MVLPIAARRYVKANGSLAGAAPNLLSAIAASALWGMGITTAIGAARVAQLGNSLTPKVSRMSRNYPQPSVGNGVKE